MMRKWEGANTGTGTISCLVAFPSGCRFRRMRAEHSTREFIYARVYASRENEIPTTDRGNAPSFATGLPGVLVRHPKSTFSTLVVIVHFGSVYNKVIEHRQTVSLLLSPD